MLVNLISFELNNAEYDDVRVADAMKLPWLAASSDQLPQDVVDLASTPTRAQVSLS